MQPEKNRTLKVLLVRHGQTEDNKTETIAGHRPGKLTALGRSQAQKIGIYLAKEKKQFDFIYVSDLGRTKQTFQNASSKYPYLKSVNTKFTPLVRQRCGGILQGQKLITWKKNAQKQGKNIRVYKCQGGQSWQDVNKRASKLIEQLIITHLVQSKQLQQTKILVVTHGGFIMEFVNVVDRLQGKPEKFDNTAKNCSMHEFQISYPQQFYQKYQENKVHFHYTLQNFVGHLSA